MSLGLLRGHCEGSLGVVGGLGMRISEWDERGLEFGVWGGQGVRGEGVYGW